MASQFSKSIHPNPSSADTDGLKVATEFSNESPKNPSFSPLFPYIQLSPNHVPSSYATFSPKSALARSKLVFVFLCFGSGILLGGVANYVRLNFNSNCSMFRKSNDGFGEVYNLDSATSSLRSGGDNAAPLGSSGEESLRSGSKNSFQVAWLMSFPNSGTSYTSYLIRTVTGHNTASNYGLENKAHNGSCIPVFEHSPSGPFWTDPHLGNTAPPSGYLLTKTHCGGRCDQCPPGNYVENHQLFLKHCLEGDYEIDDGNGELVIVKGSYDKELVKRAVHLIRDPFDNVVSRFHLAYKHFIKRNHTDKLIKYPRSRAGFRAFCRDLGERFEGEEKKSKFYKDVLDVVKNVPCHADFFRYVQWHNLAFTTTWDLGIPTLIVHYENYTDDFNGTKDGLLDFLELEDNYEPPEFIAGKTYREYFSEKEVKLVSDMVRKLAMEITWRHTMHYFG